MNFEVAPKKVGRKPKLTDKRKKNEEELNEEDSNNEK